MKGHEAMERHQAQGARDGCLRLIPHAWTWTWHGTRGSILAGKSRGRSGGGYHASACGVGRIICHDEG